MEEKDLIINLLKQTADSITNTFGDKCEVAIHDLTTITRSLIYITGNVTNREIGSPVTDAVLNALVKEGGNVKDRYGFKTITDDGRELKSTTVFVRNSKDEVIAALCINFDTTDYLNAMQALDKFVGTKEIKKAHKISKKMAFSIDNTVDSLFEQAVTEIGKRPATMTTDEKIRLVKILERKGAFQIKGVVNQVALRLGVSNFTIYNYLKKIRAVTDVGVTDVIG